MQETKSKPLRKRTPKAPPENNDSSPERSQGDFESERDLHNSNKRSNPGPDEEIDSPRV